MKIHKGDNVQIMIGKDRGKQGKVLKMESKSNKIYIQGLNVFKKHQRPKKQNEKGEIISVNRPLNISNVKIVCTSCNKPTRVGFKIESENKVRYCKKCQAII